MKGALSVGCTPWPKWAGLCHHIGTSFYSWISHRHLSIHIISINIFPFFWQYIFVSFLRRIPAFLDFHFEHCLYFKWYIHFIEYRLLRTRTRIQSTPKKKNSQNSDDFTFTLYVSRNRNAVAIDISCVAITREILWFSIFSFLTSFSVCSYVCVWPYIVLWACPGTSHLLLPSLSATRRTPPHP
jgi:hypothetical protein